MHALFAHKSLQITFLPCIRLVRGEHCLRSPAHDDNTVRRHATGSALEGERGEAVQKAPRFRAFAPSFFLPSRSPPLAAHAGSFRGDAGRPMCLRNIAHKAPIPLLCSCTQWLRTPPSKYRIRGKEDKGGETKKNLPSPTRRPDVERQRIEGDNGVFEEENSPHFDGTVALPEGGVHNANTPPVQLHARAAHAAKQNRIRGKEDKGGEMKKNLPSPTRRPAVDIRVNKMQANPASGPTPTEGEGTCRRAKRSADFPLAAPGTHCTMRLHNEGHARATRRAKERRSDKKTRKRRSM